MTASSANGTVQNLSYSFNLGGGLNNGSVAAITNNLNTGRTQTLTYDNLNRIGTAKSQATSGTDCWGQSFGYDRYGSLLNVNATQCSAPTLSLNVNGNNQITNPGFTYDVAGNLTNDGSQAYAFNAENQLNSAAGVSYSYDGLGQRLRKSTGELSWRNLNGHLLAESDSSGNMTSEYIYFAGRLIARRDASGAVYYYFSDRLHSNRVMTDANGIVQQQSDYYPYGGERVIVNNVNNEHKFTGKKRDPESGLDHALYRMYHPNLGRWLSADPAAAKLCDPQTLNRYAYVHGNVTNLTDSLGLDDDLEDMRDDGGGGGGGGFTFSVTVWAPGPDNTPQPPPLPPPPLIPFIPLPPPPMPIPAGGGGGAPAPQPKPQPKPPNSNPNNCEKQYQDCIDNANAWADHCAKVRFGIGYGIPQVVGPVAGFLLGGPGGAVAGYVIGERIGAAAAGVGVATCIRRREQMKIDCANQKITCLAH